ncbi:hypothetical protein BBJ28_00001122 [Nothophytophthora sp. Chile5]|nr:hypothetical protein BBJ28_00001122 [Nothophytophthora sp. Chile5]
MAQRSGTDDRMPDVKHGSSAHQLKLMAGQSAAPPALHERQASLAGAQLNALLALARNGEDDEKDGRGMAASADLFEGEPLRVLDQIGGAQGAFGDSEPATSLPMDLQLEMLRGKLSRRNQVLEVIRRAYYRDVIIIKEELRQHGGKLGNPAVLTARGAALHRNGSFPTPSGVPDGGLSSVPSVDLRDVLQLFAPSETVLQVHPCESCGGHLELVHGELTAARQEMARASKGEQQMRTVVHRMRSEAKQMEEVNDALQQRVKALLKENAYTLEQVQASRKMEREQKVMIASMRSKLQLAQATQEEIDRLSNENKDIKQQLIRSNHDRDIFSASNNHLKEELAQVTKALHVVKVEKAQIESDFGTSYYRLQEETKKAKELTADLAARDVQLKEKAALCEEQHHSLTSLKEELASTLQHFEQTKRHLEDQLIEEERAREEMQEQNFEFRRMNKKLMRDLENLDKPPLDMVDSSMLDDMDGAESRGSGTKKERPQRTRGSVQTAAIHGNVRKRLDDLHIQLEWASMRENDLAGMLGRQATGPKPPLKRTLSRMASKTVIARTATSEAEAHRPAHANAPPTDVKETAGPTGESTTNSQEEASSSESPRNEEQSTGQPATLDDMSIALEINEKNFEAYHKEVARMLTEVDEGKDKIAKQQKVITVRMRLAGHLAPGVVWVIATAIAPGSVMERRKNHSLSDRLEESKLSIEALTGSAGAAEQLEAMMLQIEENKRDQLYEMERGRILMVFLRHISESVHDVSDNKALLIELDLELVPPDDSHNASDGSENGTQMAELQRKKREVWRKVLMDKAMKKFGIMCHNRSELISVEMTKLRANVERLREDLDQAENKIDSDQLHIRTLEAEIAKLRLTVEMGKNTLGKTEKALKSTVQTEKFTTLTAVYTKLEEDQKRLTMLLFEKTKAWQKEISANDKIEKLEATIAGLTKEQGILQSKVLLSILDEIEKLADFRRRTNCSVEVSAIPEITETEMQTDRWKPQGLLLRQRNGPDRLPQRYLGKASVVIHCPELNRLPSPGVHTAPVPHNQDVGLGFVTSLNGQMSTETTTMTDTDEHLRGLLELKVYPSAKAGGRQIKTSYASSRPKALSRLYLSSDGISQKYIAPTPRQNSGGEGQQHRVSNDGRPYTSL